MPLMEVPTQSSEGVAHKRLFVPFRSFTVLGELTLDSSCMTHFNAKLWDENCERRAGFCNGERVRTEC